MFVLVMKLSVIIRSRPILSVKATLLLESISCGPGPGLNDQLVANKRMKGVIRSSTGLLMVVLVCYNG